MSSVKREWGWGDVVPSLCLGVFIFFVFWPHFSEKQGESCTPVIAMALVKGLRKPETFFLSFFFFFLAWLSQRMSSVMKGVRDAGEKRRARGVWRDRE